MKPFCVEHWGNNTRLILSVSFAFSTIAFPSAFAANPVAVKQDPAIQVDDKITTSEKKHHEKAVEKSNRYASEQANAINKVPGAKVTTEDLKEKKKSGPGLNPIGWLLRPVTRLQEQTVRLEQQIMKLTGPIAALQPGMLNLEKSMSNTNEEMQHVRGQMVTVTGKMDDVNSRINNVQSGMGGVRNQMAAMQKDISAMRAELSSMKKPLVDLKKPIVELRDPLMEIRDPITTVGSRVSALDQQVRDLKGLISLVLTSIFVAAILIAVGTPVAGILIWRNKHKLLPKPKPEEARAEQDMSRAGRLMDRQIRR